MSDPRSGMRTALLLFVILLATAAVLLLITARRIGQTAARPAGHEAANRTARGKTQDAAPAGKALTGLDDPRVAGKPTSITAGPMNVDPLLNAVLQNNLADARRRLAQGADPNKVEDVTRATPLRYAVTFSTPPMIELLVGAGADMQAADPWGGSALHHAAYNNRPDNIHTLLRLGAELDAQTVAGMTALHWSCGYRQPQFADGSSLDTIRILLEAGADVSLTDNDGMSALDLATASRQDEICKMLLEAGAQHSLYSAAGLKDNAALTRLLDSPDFNPQSDAARRALYRAALNRNSAGGRLLQERGVEGSIHTELLLGDAEAVEARLRAGADPNDTTSDGLGDFGNRGQSAMQFAARRDDPELIRLLLAYGGDPQTNVINGEPRQDGNFTPLGIAVNNSNLRTARALLEAGANPGLGRYDSPLSSAIRENNREALELLIEFGAELSPSQEQSANTPVFTASQSAAPGCLELLLVKGAALSNGDVYSDPLDAAIYTSNGSPEDRLRCLELLLAAGADPNGLRDVDRPLLKALHRGLLPQARALLEAGADPNASGSNGSALMLALALRDQGLIKLLLVKGAQLEQADKHGVTPLALALAMRDEQLAVLLRAEGAAEPSRATMAAAAAYVEERQLLRHDNE